MNNRFIQCLKQYDKDQYPVFYAGNYLKEGSIVVGLIEEFTNSQIKEEIQKAIPNVQFEYKKYSYQELLKYYQSLNDRKAYDDISKEYYIDDQENCIQVGLENLNLVNQTYFLSKYGNYGFIKFYKYETMAMEVAYQPGHDITRPFLYGGANVHATLGFSAVDHMGNSGFVTTLHDAHVISATLHDSVTGNAIGQVSVAAHGGSTDACFARLNAGHSVSNDIIPGIVDIAGTGQFVIHVPVTLYGGVTHLSNGQICSTHLTCNGLTDLYKCDYHSAPGDSGGPVLVANHFLIGIHIAGNNHHTAVCKYRNISQSLGIRWQ